MAYFAQVEDAIEQLNASLLALFGEQDSSLPYDISDIVLALLKEKELIS
ncbi:hypothetical protein [Photobacterium sp. R1]